MSYHDPDFDAAPKWLIRLIHAVIIICGLALGAAFLYTLSRLP